MRFPCMRTLVAAAFLCAGSGELRGQEIATPPTQLKVGEIAARPEAVQRLRQLLQGSGMTPEQIRARLYAAGYPPDLLDPYFPGVLGPKAEPTNEVLAAIEELGLAELTDVEFLRGLQTPVAPPSTLAGTPRDSLPALPDSLAALLRPRAVRSDVADAMVRADSGFNIFGLEIFRSSPMRFEPAAFGPVDANYRLGPGDQLVLILTGDVEETHTLDVTREGFVVIPQVGQIFVANLTLGQLEDLLFTRLGRVFSGVRRGAGATTRFSVSVTKLRANQVFVLGDVERPGSYMVSSAGTAIAALYAAGGPTAQGSLRNIQIKRGGTLVSALDLYDYLLRGDASHDARLETGDVVFVPPRALRVRVVGEVVRPATYELKAGESLADLLRAAGGLRAEASRRRVQVERILPPAHRTASGRDRITIDLESDDLGNGGAERIQLEAGDVVRVFPIAERVRNTVTVTGNVWTPGPIGLEPGMTITEAIKQAGGPKPDLYLGQVLVSRMRADSSRFQLRASFRDSLGNVADDFPLVEDDLIEVFSVIDFRPERYVAIGGAVRRPGRYPYREGMTMRDLVLLANGLQESAYLKEAEVARLPNDRSGPATAITIRVPLDSTYLFERAGRADGRGVGRPGIELKPYDNVLIMQQPNWSLQRVVTVNGEVNFPGQYALTTRNERLADLIRRAGGLTAEAYPEGTVFLRRRGAVGRVAIDVPQVLRNARSPENLLLMDGDQITVPQKSFVVTVRGAVNAPNVVAYVPGRGVDYYVSQAGGAARNGDRRRAFVTQPSGKRETKGRFTEPRPLAGSFVEVPVRDPSQTSLVQTITNVITPTVTSLITLYLLIQSLDNR